MPEQGNDLLDPTLNKLLKWKSESQDIRSQKDIRNARNLKLIKGIWRDEDKPKSAITGKDKVFFRKIWATEWRLTATMYQSFMKDPESFRIEGRDLINDPRKARVLQKVVKYRKEKMDDDGELFIKFIWAIQAMLTFGWVCAKMAWVFDPETGKDEQEFIVYPFEQVFPDMVAETENKMRYIHFLNYLTKEEMEELGYDTKFIEVTAPESNQLRDVRFRHDIDPQIADAGQTSYSAPFGGVYPPPGSSPDNEKLHVMKRFKVFESFWKEGGRIWYAVSNDFRNWLVKPKESAYGDKFPIITGQLLTEMNKLMGEGLPEPLEAPQESYNHNMHMRKDNIATAMAGHTFVSRYGGVDINSLLKRRANGITLMDDVNAVKHEQMPDVTKDAYNEAAMDEAMMDEMSGDTPAIRGTQSPEIKATTAQINFQQSNAKIDLYVAIIGQFFKKFYMEMARQIQLFETDEFILRVANEQLRVEDKDPFAEEIFDLDFNVDLTMEVGAGVTGQGVQVQQILMAMDRAIMTLQATASLAQLGAIPKEGLQLPNVSRLYQDLLPLIGHRNVKDYFITIPPPQNPAGGGGGPANPKSDTGFTNNEQLQRGSLGGV